VCNGRRAGQALPILPKVPGGPRAEKKKGGSSNGSQSPRLQQVNRSVNTTSHYFISRMQDNESLIHSVFSCFEIMQNSQKSHSSNVGQISRKICLQTGAQTSTGTRIRTRMLVIGTRAPEVEAAAGNGGAEVEAAAVSGAPEAEVNGAAEMGNGGALLPKTSVLRTMIVHRSMITIQAVLENTTGSNSISTAEAAEEGNTVIRATISSSRVGVTVRGVTSHPVQANTTSTTKVLHSTTISTAGEEVGAEAGVGVGVGPMMVSMGRVMGSMGSISRQGAYGTLRLSRHLITTTRMLVRLLRGGAGTEDQVPRGCLHSSPPTNNMPRALGALPAKTWQLQQRRLQRSFPHGRVARRARVPRGTGKASDEMSAEWRYAQCFTRS